MFRIHDFLEYEYLKFWLRERIQKDRKVYDFKDLSEFIHFIICTSESIKLTFTFSCFTYTTCPPYV